MLAANADEGPICCISAFYCGDYCRRGSSAVAIALASGASACNAAESSAGGSARARAGGKNVSVLRPSNPFVRSH
jgi:hypothetical protein